ncbi:MAG: tRNA pseudouridine(55) synthase TruB [Pseudomonadota bacterium]
MARRRKGLSITGWLNFNKPLEMSSNQAVGKARWLLKAKKAGHAGTLDPLATGVLPIAFGEATKVMGFLTDAEKAYRFSVAWGASTTTDDLEGEVTERSDVRPSKSAIEAVLPRFIGLIQQRPPAYSAIKVNGQRAYALARAGEEVVLNSRDVTIHDVSLRKYEPESAVFDVRCGKGTYVRSLARDLALALGTVGHVTALERRQVGPFHIEAAIGLEKLEATGHKPSLLDPLETVLDDIPALAVSDQDAAAIRFGRAISNAAAPLGEILLSHNGEALALATHEETMIHPKKVFQRPDHDGDGPLKGES